MSNWNFRKRIKIAPGITLNLSKSGVSTSIGPKGAKISFGEKGTYLNTSIPGSGLYKRQRIHNSSKTNSDVSISSINKINNWGCAIPTLIFITSIIYLIIEDYIIAICLFSISICILTIHLIAKKKKNTRLNNNIDYKKESTNSNELTYGKFTNNIEDQISAIKIDASELDPLFEESARIVVINQQGSTFLIQKKFSIGFDRANKIMEQLESVGIVGPFNGVKARAVVIPDELSLDVLLEKSHIID